MPSPRKFVAPAPALSLPLPFDRLNIGGGGVGDRIALTLKSVTSHGRRRTGMDGSRKRSRSSLPLSLSLRFLMVPETNAVIRLTHYYMVEEERRILWWRTKVASLARSFCGGGECGVISEVKSCLSACLSFDGHVTPPSFLPSKLPLPSQIDGSMDG